MRRSGKQCGGTWPKLRESFRGRSDRWNSRPRWWSIRWPIGTQQKRKWFMSRKILVALALATLAFAQLLAAQDRGGRSGRIHVDNYAIDAEINPRTQALTANAKVRFIADDSDISSVSFELNNAFNVTRVVDDAGRQIPASRSGQDQGVRLSLATPLVKGKPNTVTFTYDGRLTGQEDSPVFGIKFGAIQNDIKIGRASC